MDQVVKDLSAPPSVRGERDVSPARPRRQEDRRRTALSHGREIESLRSASPLRAPVRAVVRRRTGEDFQQSARQDEGADLVVDGRGSSCRAMKRLLSRPSAVRHVKPGMKTSRESWARLQIVRQIADQAIQLPSKPSMAMAVHLHAHGCGGEFASKVNVGMVGINVRSRCRSPTHLRAEALRLR